VRLKTSSDRLVVFDIGNVLLSFDTGIAARNFDRLDPGKGRPLAEALWSSPLMHRFETGRISGTDLFGLVRRRFDLRMTFSAFRRAFTGIFQPIRENLALFRRFTRTRRVALLSNVNEIHWAHIMRRYPVLKKAHHPLGSHRIGAMKPDRRAFKAVAEASGAAFKRMVYVDDREEFIRAAKRLGITGIHYTGKRSLRDLFKDEGLE
jgi:glucose-1-phosphatase